MNPKHTALILTLATLAAVVLIIMGSGYIVEGCAADKICYPNRSVALITHGNFRGAVCASPGGPFLKKE